MNTLTPLIKRLEQLGLVQRQRMIEDERVVMISLSEERPALKEKCGCIPTQLFKNIGYPADDALALKGQLDVVLQHLNSVSSPDVLSPD